MENHKHVIYVVSSSILLERIVRIALNRLKIFRELTKNVKLIYRICSLLEASMTSMTSVFSTVAVHLA